MMLCCISTIGVKLSCMPMYLVLYKEQKNNKTNKQKNKKQTNKQKRARFFPTRVDEDTALSLTEETSKVETQNMPGACV